MLLVEQVPPGQPARGLCLVSGRCHETMGSEDLVFGFVPSHVLDDINDMGNWKVGFVILSIVVVVTLGLSPC